MTYHDLLKIFQNEYGISRPADIARRLDVSPQALSNWKSRNQIPYKYVSIIEKELFDHEKKASSSVSNEKVKNFNVSEAFDSQGFNIYKEDPISFKEIYHTLRKNYKQIVVASFLFSLIGLFYIFFIATPVFISSATIFPATNENTLPGMSGLASQFGIEIPNNNQATKLIYPEIIKSRTLSKKMLKKNFSTLNFGEKQSLLDILTRSEKESGLDKNVIETLAITKFIESIIVSEDLKSSLITISIRASEAILASQIANSLIKELDEHQRQFNTEQAVKKRVFIQERIIEVEKDLIDAEEQLKKWRQRNKNISNSPALLLEQERLTRETELQKQLFITLKQEFEMAKIEEVEDSEILHVLDYPEVPLFPSSPNKKLIIIFSLVFGIIFSFIKIFALENFRNMIS